MIFSGLNNLSEREKNAKLRNFYFECPHNLPSLIYLIQFFLFPWQLWRGTRKEKEEERREGMFCLPENPSISLLVSTCGVLSHVHPLCLRGSMSDAWERRMNVIDLRRSRKPLHNERIS